MPGLLQKKIYYFSAFNTSAWTLTEDWWSAKNITHMWFHERGKSDWSYWKILYIMLTHLFKVTYNDTQSACQLRELACVSHSVRFYIRYHHPDRDGSSGWSLSLQYACLLSNNAPFGHVKWTEYIIITKKIKIDDCIACLARCACPQVCSVILPLQCEGHVHWSVSVWRRFLWPDTVRTHSPEPSALSVNHTRSSSFPFFFSFLFIFLFFYDFFFFYSSPWNAAGSTGWLVFNGTTPLSCLTLIPCVSY